MQIGPERFPRLDNVKFLSVQHGAYLEHTHLIGTRPSDQVTGLIGAWFVEVLKSMPSLRQMEIECCLYADEAQLVQRWRASEVGFRFRTYTNGDRTLFNLRHRSAEYDHEFVIGTHHLAYLRRDMSFYHNIGAHTPQASDNPRDIDGIAVDLTSYRGLPLPTVLLDWILASREEDGAWITGERDLDLSEEVWDVLDAWVDEVEAAVDWETLQPEDLDDVDYCDLLRGVWTPGVGYVEV